MENLAQYLKFLLEEGVLAVETETVDLVHGHQGVNFTLKVSDEVVYETWVTVLNANPPQ